MVEAGVEQLGWAGMGVDFVGMAGAEWRPVWGGREGGERGGAALAWDLALTVPDLGQL